MYRKRLLFIPFLLIGIVFAAVFVNAILGTSTAITNETKSLGNVEIREYEGQDLSSINDFIENSIRGPQYIDIEDYRLTVTGLVSNKVEYTYDDVISNYQSFNKVVELHCVEGWSVTILWEGILVEDLLEEAKVDSKATVVIFYAYDDYSTSLPLDYIINNKIMIAYKMNNVTLPPERGFPFQLVAESKWGYKWIKWITAIELSDDEGYRGYWESRGYPNEADLSTMYPWMWGPPITVDDITAPVADAGDAQTVDENTIVTLDGSNSTDNREIMSYVWAFKDVATQALLGATVTYNFTNPGTYVVRLVVTDVGGNFDIDNVTLTVNDVTSPTADAESAQKVKVNKQVSFDASGSSDNVGIVIYEWDFGDGNIGTGIATTHTYTKAKTYAVTLTVIDAAGNSHTDPISIKVESEFPWTTVGIGVAIAAILAIAMLLFLLRMRARV